VRWTFVAYRCYCPKGLEAEYMLRVVLVGGQKLQPEILSGRQTLSCPLSPPSQNQTLSEKIQARISANAQTSGAPVEYRDFSKKSDKIR
jgi:hypothetical protein